MKLSEEELNLFELAFNLRIPLYKLMEEMTYEELLGWGIYFDERPFGWRDDYRFATIMKMFSNEKLEVEKIFPTLAPLFNKKENIASSLKGSAMFLKITNAKGGEKIRP